MTRFPGVLLRPDSRMYQFVLRAPADLLEHFPSGWALRCSLRTGDLRTANDKAKRLHAELAERFDALRRTSNPQATALTSQLVARLAAEVRRGVLVADDNMREFPEVPEALVKLLQRQAEEAPRSLLIPTDPPADRDDLGGLSEEQLDAVAGFNAKADQDVARALAARNLRGALVLANDAARSMGYTFDWSGPEGKSALQECLRAYRRAAAEVVQRDAGQIVDTPSAPSAKDFPEEPTGNPEPKPTGHTFTDAFKAWHDNKPGRPAKSVQTYRRAAQTLTDALPGKTVEMMTREDGRNFAVALQRDAFAKGGNAMNTAGTVLSRCRTLLAQAVDLEWVPKNPLTGRQITRVEGTRGAWTEQELKVLFNDPLFLEYRLPTASMAGRDAAYWLPLIGLYTGARISELAQLGINDLVEDAEAGWVLSIHEKGENQSVKNAYSVRKVPVHSELIRLGLLQYRQDVAATGADRLWPAVVFTKLNGAGGKVSQWFGNFKTGKGFAADRTFHSFRHTVETRLRAISVHQSHIDAITGHGKRSESDGYGHLTAADVRPSLERLLFPGLALPKVFRSAPA